MEFLINFLRNILDVHNPLAVNGFRIPEQLEKTHEFLKGKHIKTIEEVLKGE